MENFLSIETHTGPMNAFIASNTHAEQRPVMIVLQEAYGVNHHIKQVCRRFAEAGYIAIAPELYHREGRHVVVEYGKRDEVKPHLKKLDNRTLLEDVQDVMNFLPELPYVDLNRIYTIGFCMGGFTSLLSATALPISGAISFYGAGVTHVREGIGLRPYLQDLSKIHCPVLLIYGESDASIPAREREAIRTGLSEADIDYEMLVYPGADHGFFCDERKVYHQAAASNAWKKSIEWLKKMRPLQAHFMKSLNENNLEA